MLDVEYEVASTTDDDSASSASSGTDDFVYKAATAAYYQFNALNGDKELSDDDSDEFILADTEDDTDGSFDLELGQADYWKCVKCNNKQNNPLYRYCEKCYQVSPKKFNSLNIIKKICCIYIKKSKVTTKHVETCLNNSSYSLHVRV